MTMMIEDFKSDVDSIRLSAYDGIEQLTDIELMEYFEKLEYKLIKKYKLKIIKNVESES